MSPNTILKVQSTAIFRLAFLALLAGLGSMALLQPAYAGGVVGTGNPASCTEAALNSALAGGGTVTFNCGGPKTIAVTRPMTITVDTVIQGGGTITITGGMNTGLFYVVGPASLTLNDIVLEQGKRVGSDGGAIQSGGSLTLSNVAIRNSQTDLCGGAIWTNGVVNITNSTFYSNTGHTGGAICTGSLGGARLQITNSSFTSNSASTASGGNGGAILVNSGILTLTNGSILNNRASAGAGIYLAQGTVATLVGSGSPLGINGNTASRIAGGIFNAGTLAVTNASFSANTAPVPPITGEAGAILNLGSLTVESSDFRLNMAGSGGAIYVGQPSGFALSNARATINRSTFSENSGSKGAGLYTDDPTTYVTMTQSAFDLNVATLAGGGIYRVDAHLNISRSSLTRGSASDGGGMYADAFPTTAGGYVEVHDTTISSSTGTRGGAVFNGGQINFQGVTVKGNSSGVFNYHFGGGEIMRMNDTVLENTGLNCDGDGTPISSAGGNFSADNSCGLTNPSDQQGIGKDPKLGALTKDPLGNTYYHVPQSGSPLINSGVPPCSQIDQRGGIRFGTCDIGAIEFGALIPSLFLPVIMR